MGKILGRGGTLTMDDRNDREYYEQARKSVVCDGR